jgi:DNA-binding PucR family transcriptional regulator
VVRGTDYLEHFGDATATATALGLHASTLRYRLRRIQKISGVDLTNPDQRLVCQPLLREGAKNEPWDWVARW